MSEFIVNKQPVILKGLKIGELAAEADHSLLEKCFVDNGQLRQLLDIQSNSSIIVGRTGAGKSAMLFKLGKEVEHATLLDPTNISIRYLEHSNIIQFFTSLGIKLDLFYRMLWRHILTVELIKLRYNIHSESDTRNILDRLREMFFRNDTKKRAFEYFIKWGSRFWLETDERLRELTTQFTEELKSKFGTKYSGIDISAEGAKKISEEVRQEIVSIAQSAVDGLQIQRLDEVVDMLRESSFEDRQKRFYILIDKLDEDWAETETRYRFVRALIEETKVLRHKLSQVKIVSALRRDLLDIVFDKTRGSGFQQEKYEAYMLPLQWSMNDLQELIVARINEVYKSLYTKDAVTINDIFPSEKGGITPTTHIVNKSLMRPRDVIQYVNECFRLAVDRERVSWNVIRSAESAYSNKRLKALGDEWFEIYPALDTTIEILRAIRTPLGRQSLLGDRLEMIAIELTSCDINDPCTRLAVSLLDPDSKTTENDLLFQILICLYHVGAIGVKVSSTEPFMWSYLDQPSISKSEVKRINSIQVHEMLHSALEVDVTQILKRQSHQFDTRPKEPHSKSKKSRNKRKRK